MKKSKKTQYETLTEDPEFKKELAVESLVLEASGIIAGLMADQGVSKAELARKLSKSRPWITQLLSGKANMTVRTLAEVVHALGAEVKLEHRGLIEGSVARSQSSRYVIESGTVTPDTDDILPFKPEYAA